jgi:hypothetical protein
VNIKGSTQAKPLDLSFGRVFCSRHGEPFRHAWPQGFGLATILLFRKVTELPQTLADARRIAGVGPDEEVEISVMERVLDEKPACCRLPPLAVLEVYLEIHRELGWGSVDRCVNCKLVKSGTPYKTSHSEVDHLCFECVLFCMEPLN